MLFGVLLLTIGVTLIAYGLYKLSTKYVEYFDKRNVKSTGLSFALYNLYGMIFGKLNGFQFAQRTYNAFPNEPIFGMFDFNHWQYMVRDPEVYKKIAIKDFDHFEDHVPLGGSGEDNLFASALMSMKGEMWRQMRATLSPAFTGNKMRQMFELVLDCANEVVAHFKTRAENGDKLNIEMKEFFSRYTNDVIASTAFGVKVNSFNDPENEFFMNGKEMMNFTGFKRILALIVSIFLPKVASLFNIKVINSDLMNTFKSLILDTIDTRKKMNIFRPDMINMLMQVREGSLKYEEETKDAVEGFATVVESEIGKTTVTRTWNDDEIVAQCMLFFLAGFEVSSSILSFAAYELVANPDIQQKLYEEIAQIDKELNGKRLTYERLQKMKYLDQVICETLRKYPTNLQTDRVCVKDYTYDDGTTKFTIEKGSVVFYSLYGIHHDPKYYPNPEKFDPERFSDENKDSIAPVTYVPFGLGPRNCIGSRLALMKLKGILYYLLLNFTFEANEATQIPLEFKKAFVVAAEKGVNLELKPRLNK